jgi:hypothetical protein
MNENRRVQDNRDRRAKPRGGRRRQDAKKPWYMRRRLWLAAASLVYVGWRRMRSFGRSGQGNRSSGIAA